MGTEKEREQEQNALAVIEELNSPVAVADPADNRAFDEIIFNDAKFAKMDALAEMMSKGVATVPKEMRNKADCFAICMQSMQWGMNPFVVVQKSHLVNGKIGYEAQLINAVIVNSGAINGRPDYEFIGNWDAVEGKLPGGWNPADEKGVGVKVTCEMKTGEVRSWTCLMSSCKVRNSPNWKTKPRLQCSYQALKEWCRMYSPDVILGVYSNDELAPDPIAEIREIPNIEGGNVDKLAALMDDEPVQEVRKPEVTIEPEEKPKPEKKPAAKKPAKKEPVKEEPKQMTFEEAVKAMKVPVHLIIEWCVAHNGLANSEQTLDDLPPAWKQSFIDNPEKTGKQINAWCDGEEQ